MAQAQNEGRMEVCMNFRRCQEPVSCESEDYEPFMDVIDQVYQEIFALREGRETIIRTYTFYYPLISGHQDCGTVSACIKCWDSFNNAVQAAADKNGVLVADVYTLFNGPGHEEDPAEKGHIGSDRVHPSQEGFTAISELIWDLGLDPVIP